ATAEVTATAAVIEERLDSSSLEVTERHGKELLATEVGSVVFALKSDIAADLYGENIALGRFVIEDGTLISGDGIIRRLSSDSGGSAQTVRLDEKFIIGEEGSFVDLTRERREIDFHVTTLFLDYLGDGNKVLFRLRDPHQVEPVARMAFEHDMNFTFGRDGERINLILYRNAVESKKEWGDQASP
ncbi:MAG TPA: elongation factor Tu, partial [Geobacteraceae bacterium]|nr:elongation factor Tu [Geobacteraceae bacterium]